METAEKEVKDTFCRGAGGDFFSIPIQFKQLPVTIDGFRSLCVVFSV